MLGNMYKQVRVVGQEFTLHPEVSGDTKAPSVFLLWRL